MIGSLYFGNSKKEFKNFPLYLLPFIFFNSTINILHPIIFKEFCSLFPINHKTWRLTDEYVNKFDASFHRIERRTLTNSYSLLYNQVNMLLFLKWGFQSMFIIRIIHYLTYNYMTPEYFRNYMKWRSLMYIINMIIAYSI